jgi:hypothetical protein
MIMEGGGAGGEGEGQGRKRRTSARKKKGRMKRRPKDGFQIYFISTYYRTCSLLAYIRLFSCFPK